MTDVPKGRPAEWARLRTDGTLQLSAPGMHVASWSVVSGNNRSIEMLAEYVRTLPLAVQLELLRMIAPAIVAEIDEQDRVELVAAINQEIVRHSAPRAGG